MKKDIEWLKRVVLDNKFMGHTIPIDVLFELMDELDEPELTQDQVDKYLYERNLIAVDAMMVYQLGMEKKEEQ